MDPFTQMQVGHYHREDLHQEAARLAFAREACLARAEAARPVDTPARDKRRTLWRRLAPGRQPVSASR